MRLAVSAFRRSNSDKRAEKTGELSECKDSDANLFPFQPTKAGMRDYTNLLQSSTLQVTCYYLITSCGIVIMCLELNEHLLAWQKGYTF